MVPRCSQITNNLVALRIEWRCPESSADEFDGHGFGFLIRKGDESFGSLSIDKLDAEDFRVREGSADGDS